MDIALLLIRMAIGLVVAAHGAQKVLGWFAGPGPAGTGKFLESLGFRPGRPYAWLLGRAELVGGSALALGLLTPLAAAAVAGVMVAAIAVVHWSKGLFASNGGYELPLVLAVGSIALAFSGAGWFSLDHVLGWDLGGVEWGLAATALAALASASVIGSRGLRLPQWRGRPTATA